MPLAVSGAGLQGPGAAVREPPEGQHHPREVGFPQKALLRDPRRAGGSHPGGWGVGAGKERMGS